MQIFSFVFAFFLFSYIIVFRNYYFAYCLPFFYNLSGKVSCQRLSRGNNIVNSIKSSSNAPHWRQSELIIVSCTQDSDSYDFLL